MPPDITGAVRKFIPNNGHLAEAVIKVLKQVYQVHSLPLPLVKAVVERALEQSRQSEMKIDSQLFTDKLTQYASQIRPRFASQINEMHRRGKKW